MPGRKGVKRFVKTANIDIEAEDLLHNDPIGIVKIPSQNLRFVERRNENSTTESSDLVALKDYFDTKFNALEAKITNDAEAVSIDLDGIIILLLLTYLKLTIKKFTSIKFITIVAKLMSTKNTQVSKPKKPPKNPKKQQQ